MKDTVIFINPLFTEPVSVLSLPVNLLYLGSYVQSLGYEAKVYDTSYFKNEEDLIQDLNLGVSNVLMFGLSVMSSQIPSALRISKLLKAKYPNIPIVWGGVHPTLYPDQTIKNNLVDYVVFGNGEIPLAKLLTFLTDDFKEKFDGLCYKVGSEVIKGEFPESFDLANSPRIDPKLVIALGSKLSLREITERSVYGFPVVSGRGCPHKCLFCINSILGERYLRKSGEAILAELKDLTVNYGVKKIWFVDEDFLGDRKRARELVEGIIANKLDVEWVPNTRVDYFKPSYLGDKDYLELFKKAGCKMMGTGAESGSQRILDSVNKGVKVADTLNMANCLHQSGMCANFSFMIGLPNETVDDYKATLKLIDQIISIDKSFYIFGPQIYRPYPGSELYEECKKYGLKEPQSLEEWANSPYIHSEFAKSSYFSKALYPWVLYDKDLTNLVFYATLMGMKPEKPILTDILRFIGKTRCKLFYFGLPIEKKLYGFMRGSKLEKVFRRGK